MMVFLSLVEPSSVRIKFKSIQIPCFPALIQIQASNFFKRKIHGVSGKFPDLGLKVDVILVIEETPLLMDDILIGDDFLNRYAVVDRFL